MAVLVVMEMPGADSRLYDAVMAELDISREPPQELIFHAAAPIENGWQMMDVWESPEAFDRFERDRLRPALGAVLDEGTLETVGVARRDRYDVHRFIKP